MMKRRLFIAAFLIVLGMILALGTTSAHADITVVNSSTSYGASGNLSITKPSSVQAGDVLVAWVAAYGTSSPSITNPTGWTTIGTDVTNGSYTKGHLAYMVYDNSAPAGPFVWTLGTNTANSGGIIALRGCDPANPIDVSGTGTWSSGTSITVNAITNANANEMVLLFDAAYISSAYPSFSAETLNSVSMTSQFDINGGGNNGRMGSAGAYLLKSGSGSTGAGVATISTTPTNGVGALVSLIPAPTTGQAYVVASATATGTTSVAVSAPTGCAAGDVLFAWITAGDNTSDPGVTNPSGWTTIGTDVTGNYINYGHGHLAWKAWQTGETSYTWTIGGSSPISGGSIICVRGASSSTPVDITSSIGQGGGGAVMSVTIPTLTSTAANELVLVFPGGYSSASSHSWAYCKMNNTTYLPEQCDLNASTGIDNGGYYYRQIAAGATGSFYCYDNGLSYAVLGFAVAIKNAPPLNACTLAGTLSHVTASLSGGIVDFVGTLGGTLGQVTASLSGALGNAATLAGTLTQVSAALSGTIVDFAASLSASITSGGTPSPPVAQSASLDWPDYATVPQFDHVWYFYNSTLVDTPGPGKTERDLSFVNNNGDIVWAADWAGRSNHSLKVTTANGDYLTAPADADIYDLGSTFTVLCIFQTGNSFPSGWATLLNTEALTTNGWWLGFDNNGHLLWYHGANSVTVITASINTTYHCVITYSGGQVSGYINGALVVGPTILTAPVSSSHVLDVLNDTTSYAALNTYIYTIATLKGTALTLTQYQNLYDTWMQCGGGVYKRHPDNPATYSGGGFITCALTGGIINFGGALAATLSQVTAALSGSEIASTLAGTLSQVTASLTGAHGIGSTLSATLSKITAALSGSEVAGVIGATLSQVTASLTGGIVDFIGSLSANLTQVSASLTGAHGIGGTLSGALSQITAALTGSEVAGVLSATLTQVSAALTGAIVDFKATLGGTLTQVSASLSGSEVVAALSGALTQVSASLSGSIVNFAGTLSATLTQVSASLSGSEVAGVLSAALSQVTAAFTGAEGVASTLSATLSQVTASLTGAEGVAATIGATLSQVYADLAGVITGNLMTATLTATLEQVHAALTGSTVAGVISGTLAQVSAALSGAEGVAGELAGNLSQLVASLTGSEIAAALSATCQQVTASLSGGIVNFAGQLSAALSQVTADFTGAQGIAATLSGNLAQVFADLYGSIGGGVSALLDASTAAITTSLSSYVINFPAQLSASLSPITAWFSSGHGIAARLEGILEKIVAWFSGWGWRGPPILLQMGAENRGFKLDSEHRALGLPLDSRFLQVPK
jgi:hypothetical protein